MIHGYIYENENGGLLNRIFVWYYHDKLEDGFVWQTPPDQMKIASQFWQFKPVKYHTATYNPKTGLTTIARKNIAM
jgi:hypothetical protein